MKKEYQLITGLLMKKYRKENDVSLRDLSDILSIAHSHLSRMENGIRPIHDNIADHFLRESGLGMFDEDATDKCRYYFDRFYDLIVLKKMDDSYDVFQKIMKNKTKIKKTILRYHYDLYELVYRLYFGLDVDGDLIDDVLANKEFYLENDRRIFYDTLGLYYRNSKMIDESERCFQMAMDHNDGSVHYAMSAYHMTRIAYMKGDHLLAYKYAYEALFIFEKQKNEERINQCKIVIGIIYLAIKDDDKAITIFYEIIKAYEDHRYFDSIALVIHNLIHCLIRTRRHNEVDGLLDKLKADDLKDLDDETYMLILYHTFMIDDIARFDKWYDNAPKDGTYPYCLMVIELLRSIMVDKIDHIEIKRRVAILKSHDIDKDMISLLDRMMLKIYRDHGLKDEELKQYGLLYDKDL